MRRNLTAFVDLDRNKALGRMMGRFIHTGRYLSPKLIDKYANERDGNRIAQAYEELKMMDVIDGYSKWDNDVGRGEKPILLETANLDDDFIKNARMKGDMENEERKHIGITMVPGWIVLLAFSVGLAGFIILLIVFFKKNPVSLSKSSFKRRQLITREGYITLIICLCVTVMLLMM